MAARLRRRSVGPAAGAAVFVAAWLLAACGSSHPHAAAPAPATTQPPLAPPTTQAPAGPYVWTRESSPALALGGGASTTIAAVQAPSGGRPWLVAGTRASADGSTTATVWRSVDGVNWHAEPLTEPGVDSQAEAVTDWQSGTVVVGSEGRGPSEVAAVWISAGPNAPFSAVRSAELPLGAATMTTVASGGLGLFAAGEASGRVAVWYSSNGRRWTRLAAAEQVVNGATDPHVNSLTVASDGVYAAGWQRDGARDRRRRVDVRRWGPLAAGLDGPVCVRRRRRSHDHLARPGRDRKRPYWVRRRRRRPTGHGLGAGVMDLAERGQLERAVSCVCDGLPPARWRW